MGPNGSGKSTLAHVLMGRPGYQVLGGPRDPRRRRSAGPPAWQPGPAGSFPGPAVPDRDPRGPAPGHAGRGPGRQRRSGPDRRTPGRPPPGRPKKRCGSAWRPSCSNDPSTSTSRGGTQAQRDVAAGRAASPFAVLDELDSGLDVDGLRDVARRVRAAVDEWGLGVLAITHYRRLLTVLVPDVVHVLVGGRSWPAAAPSWPRNWSAPATPSTPRPRPSPRRSPVRRRGSPTPSDRRSRRVSCGPGRAQPPARRWVATDRSCA